MRCLPFNILSSMQGICASIQMRYHPGLTCEEAKFGGE